MSTFILWYPYFEVILFIVFIFINLSIVASDILTRRIPNILLIILLSLLPIWLWIFSQGNLSELIASIFLSIGLFLWGITFHNKNTFIWAWDLKYWAILLLFMSWAPLSIFIGNIGILTIFTLLFWWSLIVGNIIFVYSRREFYKEFLFQKLSLHSLGRKTATLLFDWVILGFLFSLFVWDISSFIFSYIPLNRDYYLVLMMWFFLLRSKVHYICIQWKYSIFLLSFIILYLGKKVQDNGVFYLWKELLFFGENIWKYILILSLISLITKKSFSLYDSIIGWKKLHTVPYSTILFLAFLWTYFLEIDLVVWIREYL